MSAPIKKVCCLFVYLSGSSVFVDLDEEAPEYAGETEVGVLP